MNKIAGIAVTLVIGACSMALAEDSNKMTQVVAMAERMAPKGPTVSVELGEVSAFVFRGAILQDDYLFQPNVTINQGTSYGDLFCNIWGNMALNNYAGKGDQALNEVDVTLGYAGAYNRLGYGIGVIEYVYSGADFPNTHEAYVNASYDTFLKPSVTVYYDFKEVQGFYGIASISHGINLTRAVQLVADTGLGYATAPYNEAKYGVDKDSVNDWNSGLTLNYGIIDNVTVSLGARCYKLLDSEIQDGAVATYGDDHKLVGKAAVVVKF